MGTCSYAHVQHQHSASHAALSAGLWLSSKARYPAVKSLPTVFAEWKFLVLSVLRVRDKRS